MSYKTDELTNVIPDAYAVDDAESLIYKLLDAFGAELMTADEKVKRLLKSHWVNYAEGPALDGLAAVFGLRRRLLPDGVTPESDDTLRTHLKSVVPTFAGGGTRKAVLGAVRSAFGLPFDLRDLNLPEGFDALRTDIEGLIVLEEFSPTEERLVEDNVVERDEASELMLVVDIPTVREVRPRIRWTFRGSDARQHMSFELVGTGAGIKTVRDGLVVPANEPLTLTADEGGTFRARLAGEDVSHLFVNLDDSAPVMPEVPRTRSEWRFRAQSGILDLSKFDNDEMYDLPEFAVEMSWWRYEPLTFDVRVPYFLEGSVKDLVLQHKYPGDPDDVFEFQELPPERIQEVVDQTRAAGVRGHVHFSLNESENHDQYEKSTVIEGLHRASEDAAAADSLSVGSINRESEVQGLGEVFVIGGVWDVSTFDGGYGFQ